MKLLARLIKVVLILVVILIVLLACVPALLSTERGKRAVVEKVNQHAPGTLAIDSWKLKWMGGIVVTGFRYEDDSSDVSVAIREVKLGKGLLDLIRKRNDLGRIYLSEPVIVAAVPEPPPEPTEEEEIGVEPRPKGYKKKVKKPVEPVRVELPDLHAVLVIDDGILRAVPKGHEPQDVFTELDLEVVIDGNDKPVTYSVSAKSGDGGITTKGSADLSQAVTFGPLATALDLDIQVHQLDLGEITAMASTFAPVPIVQGTATIEGSLRGNLFAGLHADVVANARNLTIPKEPGSSVYKRIGDIDAVVKGQAKGKSLSLESLKVTSSFAEIEASGQIGGEQDGSFAVESSVELGPTMAFLQLMDLMPNEMSAAGNLHASAKGTTKSGVVKISEFNVEASELRFADGEKTFSEDSVKVHGQASMDPGTRSLSLSATRVETSFSQLRLQDLSISDWVALPGGVTLNGDAQVDLAKTLAALSLFIEMEEGTSVAGDAHVELSVNETDQEARQISYTSTITSFEITSPNAPPIREDRVSASGNMILIQEPLSIRITRVAVDSAPVKLQAVGLYEKSAEKQKFEVRGTAGTDLSVVSSYIKAFSDIDITLAGSHERPFHLSSEWTGKDLKEALRHADAQFSLKADEVDGFGLHVKDLEIPLRITEGVADAALRAEVNGGTMSFSPRIDFTVDNPVIRLPAQSNVLTGVALTSEMADELLGLIHPLFVGASVVGGTTDLYIDHFNWPVDPALRTDAAFAGQLRFRDLRIAATGMVQELLEVVKINKRELEIGERDIDFECVNGRISCSTMRIRIDDYKMTLGGSMGFDQSLEYAAEVPLTEELVGSDVYKYAKDLTFRLPIRGTASRPRIDKSSVRDGVADLAEQAAKKVLEEKAGELLKDIFKKK